MKKIIISILMIALTQSLWAQDDNAEYNRRRFDLQVAQHFGLGQWSDADYVNKGLPPTVLTEFRGVGNYYLSPIWGFSLDVGIGIMPAPEMRSLNLDRMPMPHNGTQYYLREILSDGGGGNINAHFKMTFGLFGAIQSNENLTIMPYFGVGFLTMQQRAYEILLKEHGSNMQYKTKYIWNYNANEYENGTVLGYLTGRLNFKYKLANNSNLLFGLEYMWFFNSLDFYGRYTNTFNANIERDFMVKGNKINMLGISVGMSWMPKHHLRLPITPLLF